MHCVIGFSASQFTKIATKKCDFTKHLRRLLLKICSRLKVVKLGNDKVPNIKAANRLVYHFGINNHER